MKRIKLTTKILIIIAFFASIELISYFSLILPNLNLLIFLAIFLTTVIISAYRLEFGLLIALGELFIGSMGHLFILSLGSHTIAIRLVIWFVVLSVFLSKFIIQLIRQGKSSDYLIYLLKFSAKKYYIGLGIFVLIGLFNALMRGQDINLIFSDINSWFYFLLLLPAIVIYHENNTTKLEHLKTLFLAGSIWIGIKTLVLLYIFTHNLNIAPDVYFWLRRTLTGEMTPTLSGWPRIFIQGQIFSGVALFLIFWLNVKKIKSLPIILLSTLFSSVLLISFSRSFWVALIVTIGLSVILAWRFFSWRKAIATSLWFLLSFVLGFALIYFVAVFPFPTPGKFNADFASRVSNSNESALNSRWSLLPVLIGEIKKEPFFGQGFGATITYISSDPRVLEKNPSGQYTTYAFEWGYLDIWLKIGLLGLACYFVLILNLLITALKSEGQSGAYLRLGVAMSIVFLAIINIFTPYLNHPLGIGILVIGSCLIQKDRVY